MAGDMISPNNNHNVSVRDNSYGESLPVAGMVQGSLIQIVWRGRWFVLLSTVVALAAALTYLSKATPIYTSTSRVYVEQTGPKIMTEVERGVMTRSTNYLYTQVELLKSAPILAAAAVDSPETRQMRTFARVDNRIAYLKRNLDVVVGKKDEIISVSFDSPYPAEAAQIVNTVVDSYVTFNATQKRSTATEVLKILQSEKAKRSQELSEKLVVMMDFKKENMALAFQSERGNMILDRLERLSAILTEAQFATIESASFYESTKKMVSDPVGLKQFIEAQRAKGMYISTGSERGQFTAKLEELQLRKADRLRQLTTDHPAVRALDSEISHVEKQLVDLDREFAQAQLAVAEQQYLTAKAKEEEIAKHFEQQQKEAVGLNEQVAQYTILESEWEQTKKLCDILDERVKELNVTEDVGALNISILEVARAESKPSKPQKARVMGIALVLGLMIGGGLALLRDWMDQRLRSAEEVSAILGVPMLGIVPSMSRKRTIAVRGKMVD
ncbi:MAG: Wzz/FepE/Etk N-terminal domain-containing protein, partial [Sedimentisphaerales bacterium]|nr:Wzz/FepE/Etk N-terminal domain-containing protein [Sedimentisphaerales bacterium]